MGCRVSLACLGNEFCTVPLDRHHHLIQDEAEIMIQADKSSSGGLAVGQAEPENLASSSHTFKNKTFKKPKDCSICKQAIDSQGISCRVCKYACHKKCEAKVVKPCFLPINYELPDNSETFMSHVTRTLTSLITPNMILNMITSKSSSSILHSDLLCDSALYTCAELPRTSVQI
ncbi:serine/threonine-protein kinase D2-like [Terrapene carolina triunguis]|uniref:serine/threonine-protein kinase D2-like n=1 Tax=Terrapene triunguis TaxID=2587831 RepID=UPI000E7742A0|nr:serine/threonine-protein kinase D2-like [Terrapene carolina triunguis]